jgi:hypothetical protein
MILFLNSQSLFPGLTSPDTKPLHRAQNLVMLAFHRQNAAHKITQFSGS